jgi:hypothetical protein
MAALQSPTDRTSPLAALHRYWTSNGPLWRVFWIYGVATSAVLAAIYAFALAESVIWLEQIMLPIFVAYTLWIVVSVWRCAPNAEQELHALLARWLTVVWSINTLLLAGFLQLRLLGFYTF